MAKLAGVKFTWNKNDAVGSRVVDVWIETTNNNWELLDEKAFYTVSSSDYVQTGGDGYKDIADYAANIFESGISQNTVN